VCLVARELEQHGIPTVVVGSAMDIIQRVKVPRYLHTDMPLGNTLGMPGDSQMQLNTVQEALNLLSEANSAMAVRRGSAHWTGDPGWRDDYCKVDDSNREALAQRGQQRRAQQAADRKAGRKRAAMIADG
jgi:hypothetical protein